MIILQTKCVLLVAEAEAKKQRDVPPTCASRLSAAPWTQAPAPRPPRQLLTPPAHVRPRAPAAAACAPLRVLLLPGVAAAGL
jgi:hypothetical protein